MKMVQGSIVAVVLFFLIKGLVWLVLCASAYVAWKNQ